MRDALTESARAEIVGWLLAGGCALKRDDDLLRDLMFRIEAHDDPLFLYEPGMEGGDDKRRTYYHLRLLADAGFLEETGRNGGVFRMTNQGHDFLAVIRSDTAWQRTKDAVRPIAGVSLGVMRDVATAYARQTLRDMGVPI